MAESKTGGGRGTNGSRVRGRSTQVSHLMSRRQYLMAEVASVDDQIRQLQARLLETPEVSVADLAVRREAAKRQPLDVFLAAILAEDPDARVRSQVATNPTAAVPVLRRLMYDHDQQVQAAVGKNPAASLDMLEHLEQEGDFSVRASVAQNPHLTDVLVQRLSQDKAQEVRRQLAGNTRTPSDLREDLLQGLGSTA